MRIRGLGRHAWATGTAAALVAAGLALPASGAAAVSVPDPTVHYTFTEASGTTIADASGNGYDATLKGAGGTFSGEALTLPGGANGSGAAYVQIPSAVFAGQSNLTISFWMSNTTSAGNFAAAYVGNSATSNGYWLFNPANPSGFTKSVTTTATVASPDSGPWNTEVGPGRTGAPAEGIAATAGLAMYTTVIDGTNDLLSVYRDGRLVSTSSTSVDVSHYGTESALVAYLGRSPYADKFYSGAIEDYIVYREALNAEQVAAQFAAAPSADTQGVVVARDAGGLSLTGLANVTSDLSLPTAGASGTTITWASSNPAVISATGVVTRGADAASVQLTATVSLGSVSTTRTFTALVPGQVTTAAQAAAQLSLPYVLEAGTTLPADEQGASITWTTSDTALVGTDGTVVGTASGLADVDLEATLTLGATTATKAFRVKVSEADPAFVAGYTRTPAGNLASSMHLALSADGQTYQALNLNQGVLFAKADFTADALNGETKLLVDPYLFRMADGTFGVIATRTNAGEAADTTAASTPLLFTSPDLVTYDEVGLLDLHTDLTVTDPAVEYDPSAQTYRITWQGSDGAPHVSTTADFVTISDPVVAPVATVEAPVTGIASSVARNRLVLTRAEADLLSKRFSRVANTTVDEVRLALTTDDAAPTDLGKVTARYTDGTTAQLPVSWSASDLAQVDTTKPGTYTVSGTVKAAEFPFPLVQPAIADPDVFVFDGSYYLVGTTEDASQKRLYMRKASTVAGLATATAVMIYTDSTPLSWAPEVHQIGDDLYLNWARGNAWNQVKSTVVKLRAGGDPAVSSDWDWANAKEVVRSDGAAIQPQGITLDMTYFESAGTWYAMWSDRVITPVTGSADLKIATIDPADPARLTSDPVIVARPTYGWDRNGTFVVEGPYALFRDGKVIITLSGAQVNPTYVLASMSAEIGANLLDPAVWRMDNAPLLTSVNVAGQYGPGHNAYFTDLDGTLMTSLHAMVGSNGARKSTVRAVHWGAYGNLVLDMIGERHVAPANRAVTATITVTKTPVPVAATTTSLSLASSKVTLGATGKATVKVTAKVLDASSRAAVPSGTVRFTAAGTSVQATVRNGVATATLTLTKPGTFSVSARFLGTSTHTSSTASVKTLKVAKSTSSVVVKLSKSTVKKLSATRQVVTTTVTVKTAGTSKGVTGKVRVTINGQVRTVAVKNGVGTVKVWVSTSAKVRKEAGKLVNKPIVLSKAQRYKVSVTYLGTATAGTATAKPVYLTVTK